MLKPRQRPKWPVCSLNPDTRLYTFKKKFQVSKPQYFFLQTVIPASINKWLIRWQKKREEIKKLVKTKKCRTKRSNIEFLLWRSLGHRFDGKHAKGSTILRWRAFVNYLVPILIACFLDEYSEKFCDALSTYIIFLYESFSSYTSASLVWELHFKLCVSVFASHTWQGSNRIRVLNHELLWR